MRRYYSTMDFASSKLFNYLREHVFKIDKPFALGWHEWDKWRDETKAKHPFGYWATETLPDILEKPVHWFVDPINDLRYYFRMRFVHKSHYLKTNLEKGSYHEIDSRILNGCFTALVDFIELEKAWMMINNSEKNDAKYHVPWHQKHYLLRWTQWRCPQAGIDYCMWEASLDHPDLLPEERADAQAHAAREQLALYNWWKQIRPSRPDAYDASGWTEIMDESERLGYKIFDDNQPPELRKRISAASDAAHKIETEYEQEDEEMLLRLIRIRKSLWT